MAARNGSVEIFKMLHERGAEIQDIKCSVGGNQDLEPIHIACKEGHLGIVQYIISSSTNQQKISQVYISSTWSTPLHLAAYDGHFEIAEFLLNAGAKFDAQNKFKDTFLHVAIRHGHTKFILRIIDLFDKNPIFLNGKNQGVLDLFNS